AQATGTRSGPAPQEVFSFIGDNWDIYRCYVVVPVGKVVVQGVRAASCPGPRSRSDMSTEAAGDGRPGTGLETSSQKTAPGAPAGARDDAGAGESERARASADDDLAGGRGE